MSMCVYACVCVVWWWVVTEVFVVLFLRGRLFDCLKIDQLLVLIPLGYAEST